MDKPEAHLFASLNDRQQRRLIEAFVSVENKLGKQTRFDLATGWSELGRQHGVAVLFPEQKCGNNPQNCFNWFVEKRRDDGEIASIRVMIEKMLGDHQLDRDRVFVTGLSAWLAPSLLRIRNCSPPGQLSRACLTGRRLDPSTR